MGLNKENMIEINQNYVLITTARHPKMISETKLFKCSLTLKILIYLIFQNSPLNPSTINFKTQLKLEHFITFASESNCCGSDH